MTITIRLTGGFASAAVCCFEVRSISVLQQRDLHDWQDDPILYSLYFAAEPIGSGVFD